MTPTLPIGGCERRAAGAFLLVAICVLSSVSMQAQRYVPSLRFDSIATAHFLIHFHQGERGQAERLAVIAERVYRRAVPDERRGPGRTHVILSGQDDVPNGWATPTPFNVIELRTTWPRPSTVLGDTENWLETVFAHEFAHIVHLERSRGAMAAVRHVFGRVPFAMPNLFLPTWQVEGLAVWRESDTTSRGRVHNGMARRVVSTAAGEGAFAPVDRVSGGLVSWPAGDGPYLYGGLFHDYLADRFGAGSLDALAEATARWPPFLGTFAFRDVFGASVAAVWKDFAAASFSLPVAPAPERQARAVTHDGFQTGAPRWDRERSGSIYATRLTPDAFPALMRVDVSTGTATRVAWRNRGEGLGVGAGRLVFDQLDVVANVALQSDLYQVDTVAGTVQRLTSGARASEPDLNADGRVAYVVTEADRRALFVGRPEALESATPLVSTAFEYFSGPRWSPDGRTLVAERMRDDHTSVVVLIDAATGTVTDLAPGLGDRQATPAWTPDGQTVVFAVADGSAPFNLVAVSLADRQVWQVTDRPSGARAPDISPDGTRIAFLGYTNRGEDVFVMPLDRTYWRRRAAAPVRTADTTGSDSATTSAPAGIAQTYSPWHGFVPRYWAPTISVNDGLEFGALTASADALGRHAWQALATGRRDTRRLDWQVDYSYSRWRAALFASTTADSTAFDEGVERTTAVSVGAVVPFVRARRTQQLLGAMRFETLRFTPRDGDDLTLTRNAVRLGWVFSTARGFGYSVGAQEGGLVALTSEHVVPALGADGRADTVTGQARVYHRGGLPRSLVALRVAAAAAGGDRSVRRRFAAGGHAAAAGVFDLGVDAIGLVRGLAVGDVIGTRAAVANAEYRVPFWRVERGVGAYPAFFRWAYVTAFADAGDAWNPGNRARWKASGGVELSADLVLAHSWPLTVTIGTAWVRDRVSQTRVGPQTYVRIGRSF